MYVFGTLWHIPRYMGRKSSNNNKVLINNSSCDFTVRVVYTRNTITLGIRYIGEGFLIWIIPSTYLSHEVVNWDCIPGFACIGLYFGFPVLWLLYYTCSCPTFYLYSNPPVSCSYDHAMSLPYLISHAVYLLAPARHLAFVSPLAWGVLTPLDPHVQVLELGACGFSQLLIRVAQR